MHARQQSGHLDMTAVVTVVEAARLVALSKSKVYQLMNEGYLPYHKYAGTRTRRISVAALQRYLGDSKTGGWQVEALEG